MLYEEYRRKMLKIANIKRVLRRYRVLIVAVLAALVALTAAFLSVRGIVYDCVRGEESVVYGERPAYSAKALFGRVSYEYAPADSDDWTFEFPKGRCGESPPARSARRATAKNTRLRWCRRG